MCSVTESEIIRQEDEKKCLYFRLFFENADYFDILDQLVSIERKIHNLLKYMSSKTGRFYEARERQKIINHLDTIEISLMIPAAKTALYDALYAYRYDGNHLF